MTGIPKGTRISILSEELCVLYHPDDGWNAVFETDVDDERIAVSVPEESGLESDIPLWSLLTIHYSIGQDRFMFCAQLIETMEEDRLLMLRLTSGIVRNQRRSDIRLEVLQSVSGVTVPSGETGHKPAKPRPFTGVVMDISAGGLSLRTDADFRRGDQVTINLPHVESSADMIMAGEVRWVMQLAENADYRHTAGVLFKFQHQVDKERFIRYIHRLHFDRVLKFTGDT